MTNQLPSKAQVIALSLTGNPLSGHSPRIRCNGMVIKILDQQTTKNAAHMVMPGGLDGREWKLQNSEIAFRSEDLPGLRRILRRHHALQEEAGEFSGGRSIHATVDRHNAPESTDPVTIESSGERGSFTIGDRNTAGIGVFHHNGRRPQSRVGSTLAVAKLPHRRERCFEIEEIVGAQVLSLQLNGASPTSLGCAVPGRSLVRVLAVAQPLTQGQCVQPWECRR